jgi:hypothetical protein
MRVANSASLGCSLSLTVHTFYDVTIPKAFLDALPLTVHTFYDVTIPKASQEADLPICECQDLWIHAEPDSLCASLPVKFRGCPSETEIAKCEPSTQPWCMTKDKKCREQTVHGARSVPWILPTTLDFCQADLEQTLHGARF